MTQAVAPAPGWVCVGDITAIAPAWVAALGELQEVARGASADIYDRAYKYAELGAYTSHARAVLASHDLALFQVPTIEDGDVVVRTTVMHTSGAHLVFDPFRLPAGKSPQNAGSAETYARRYALMAQLGLASEDDDGAGAATRPPPPPAPLSQGNVTRFLEACHEAALSAEDIGDVVHEATEGRTREPSEAWVTEVAALRHALAARREGTPGVSHSPDQPSPGEEVDSGG